MGACALAAVQGTFGFEPADILAYQMGPVSLRPQVTTFTEFNSNILYSERDAQSDVINGVSPGLRAVIGTDLPTVNHISLSYRMDQRFYIDHHELNAMQHRITTDTFYRTERTEIKGSDRIEFLSSTLGGGFSSVSGLKVDRLVWADVYSVNYRFGQRMAALVRLEHGSIDYESGISLFDLRSLEGALRFEYLLSERTRLFGEGYFGRYFVGSNGNPADPPSSNYGGGFVGARGEFTEKLTGSAKAGYEFYQFDRTTGVIGGTESGTAPVAEIGLTYAFTEKTTLDFDYRRRQQVSAEFSRTAYVADELILGAVARLGSTDRLRVDVTGTLGFYSYDPSPSFSERNDTILGGTAGMTWLFQTWLVSRLEYSFTRLKSDLPTIREYDQHRVTASITIGY